MADHQRTTPTPSLFPKKTDDWSIGDLVDFEYAIRLESRNSPIEIKTRDKEIQSKLAAEPVLFLDNRALLKRWLEVMRSESFSPLWRPGTFSLNAIGIASKTVGAISLLAGATTASALLSYQGIEPANVSAFIGLFVIFQFTLAILSLLFVTLPSQAGRELDRFLGIRLIQPLLIHCLSGIARLAASKVKDIHRQALEEATGDLKGLWALYGKLFRWKLFSEIQFWAIAFNVGALLATLLLVVFSDRAFGWQTTLQFDSETLHRIIRLSAFPWSWLFGEGSGFPTLQEIEGSRIALKDGIRSLNSENLVSWWPYLSLGIVFYGLVPRFVFNLLGRYKSKRTLDRLSFSHAEANRIAERIRSERIHFDSDSRFTKADDPAENIANDANHASLSPSSESPALCLVASDSFDSKSEALLKAALSNTLGQSCDLLTIQYLDEENRIEKTSIELLANVSKQSVAIVFDSWMPPIEETKHFIRITRKSIQPNTSLRIVLLGLPASDRRIEAPEDGDVAIWKAFARKLGDPYCSVLPIIP